MSDNFLALLFSPNLKMFKKVQKVFMPFPQSFDPKEDHLTETEVSIFDPFLKIDDLSSLKSQLLEDYELGQDNFHVCQSGLVNLCIPQVYQFLEFVGWLALKYSST